MSKHDKFILMPMNTILKDAILATSGIGNGIETYPLCDYIIQSIFLKMTGYQEQKMKCIAWEIATNDFDYRRKLLNNEDKLGEYSTFEAKNKIYRIIYKQIEKFDLNFKFKDNVYIDDIKKRVKKNSFELVKEVFENTNLMVWNQNSYSQFLKSKIIEEEQYLKDGKNLLGEKLKNEYEELYNQRNKIAHNYKVIGINLEKVSLNTSVLKKIDPFGCISDIDIKNKRGRNDIYSMLLSILFLLNSSLLYTLFLKNLAFFNESNLTNSSKILKRLVDLYINKLNLPNNFFEIFKNIYDLESKKINKKVIKK